MTKEYWLHIRNLQEMPMKDWFTYYKESGGYLDDFDKFVGLFSQLLMSPVMYNTKIYPQIRLNVATFRIHKFYNDKFGLTVN